MTVGVDVAYRRQGIGARLVDALLDAARRDGARTVLLEVRASDEGAQRLYRRAGFRPIGRRRHYYQAEQEDAVVMRARLTRSPGPVGAEADEEVREA
jgi:ribosomal-protein-alanine N-acetyltransferase